MTRIRTFISHSNLGDDLAVDIRLCFRWVTDDLRDAVASRNYPLQNILWQSLRELHEDFNTCAESSFKGMRREEISARLNVPDFLDPYEDELKERERETPCAACGT